MAKVNSNETFSANIINAGTIVKGDIECQGDIRFDGILTGNCEQSYNYVAPTQSLLQKWLREKHDIHITITSISQESWQYHIQKPKDKLGDNYEEDFENYEEALEVGLQEALKLI